MPQATPDYKLPIWFHVLNMGALMLAAVVLLAYAGASRFVADDYPYDYGILMYGGEVFCYQPETFQYGGEYLYPAPFYTTFCALFHHAPEVLFWFWMLTPFVLLVILSGQRAAVLVFAPFVIHMRLGQSTWLLLPLIYFAMQAYEQKTVKWWYGFFVPLAIFKPHLALLPVLFLVYYGRKHWRFLILSAITSLSLLLPAFWMSPSWLTDWLVAGRGFKLPSIANLAIFPLQMFQLGEGQTPLIDPSLGRLGMLAFCGLIALGLLVALYKRRGKVEFYDWLLVFALTNPFMHDYDLILLLPLLANRPKRLLLALTAGLVVWVYVNMTTYYNASVIISLTLLVARFLRTDEHEPIQPPARWGK